MKKIAMVLLLILISVSVFAVSIGGPISATGNYWIMLSVNEKHTLVTGVLIGLCYANIYYQGFPADYISLATNEDVEMLVLAVDDTYKKSENMFIRVVDTIAVAWATLLKFK